MDFSKLGLVKMAVSGVVGVGTGKIVGKIIKNNITPETLIDKITVGAAAWTIGGIATEATKKYTSEMIDDIYNAGTEIVEMLKMNQKLGRINRNESTFEQEGLDPLNFRRKATTGKWEPKPEENTKS